MTETLVRKQIGDLMPLDKAPCGLIQVDDGVMAVKVNGWDWFVIEGEAKKIYSHTLVRPVRILDLPAVPVAGEVR